MHGDNFCAEHVHAKHVGLLALDVDGAHVDNAFQAIFGAGGCSGHAMLAGAGFGDDALFTHAPRQQNLAQHVVDLVRAGVVQLVALEIDFCTARAAIGAGDGAHVLRHALSVIERARPAHVMGGQMGEFGLERRVRLGGIIRLLKVEDQRHQGFGHEAAAKNAKVPGLVGAAAEGIRVGVLHASLLCCVLFTRSPRQNQEPSAHKRCEIARQNALSCPRP